MRFILGPSVGVKVPGPASVPSAPAKPALSDPAVTVVSADDARNVLRLAVPAFDASASNRVMEVRAYLVPSGTAPPPDAASYLSGPYPFSRVDTSAAPPAAFEFDMSLPGPPDVAPGDYFAQVVIGLDK